MDTIPIDDDVVAVFLHPNSAPALAQMQIGDDIRVHTNRLAPFDKMYFVDEETERRWLRDMKETANENLTIETKVL